MTRWKGATERVTSAAMPTIAQRPISTPPRTVVFAPMLAPAPTRVASVRSSGSEGSRCRRSGVVARGKRSLVKMTPMAMKTPSSTVTPGQMLAKAPILTRLPIRTS
jgi:hypothetical protein